MALWLIASAFGLMPMAVSAQDAIISEVRVTNVRDITFSVSWMTNQSATGEVHYGTNPANLDQIACDDRGAATSDDTHYVTLTGLSPNTTYFFDAVSNSTVDDHNGDHYSVTTGPTLGLPSSDTIYGQVFKSDGTTFADGTIVYITLKDNDGLGSSDQAAKMSSLISAESGGYWFANLGNAREADLSAYFEYSASGDSVMLLAKGAAEGCASRTVDTNADSPAAPMTLCYLFDFDLQPGWNLISLPLVPIDPAPDAVFSSIGGGYDEVHTYEGCDVTDPWKRYIPGGTENDLAAMDVQHGYWLHATSSVTLTITGTQPGITTIPLCIGRNLAGYPSQGTRPITEALSSIEGKYTLVYTYDPEDSSDPWKTYEAGAPSWVNDLTAMNPGRGYWLQVTEDCMWIVDSG